MARRTLLTAGLVVLLGVGAFALTGGSGSGNKSGCCPITSLFAGDSGGEGSDVTVSVAAGDTGAAPKAALCKACGNTKAVCKAGGACKAGGQSRAARRADGACKAGGKTCMKACRTEMMGKMAEVKVALVTVRTAVEAGQKTEALAAIGTAEKLVAEMHQKMTAKATAPKAAAGMVNTRCPMMGSKIDPAKVPASLTREFNGRKVGFCCGGCPVAWDRLTDTQKQGKLDALLK
jgi:hypothetical protein